MHQPFAKIQTGPDWVRYQSGLTVYEERWIAGRLFPRYWSSDGQVWPEGQCPIAPDTDIEAFLLEIDGVQNKNWRLESISACMDQSGLNDQDNIAQQCTISLMDDANQIRVRVCTRVSGSPVLARWLEVDNVGSEPIAITGCMPFCGRVWQHDGSSLQVEELLEAGKSPFRIAYNHQTQHSMEGDFYWDDLTSQFTFNSGLRGRSGFSRPAFWLRNELNGQTFVCEYGYSGNWEIHASRGVADWRLTATVGIGMATLPEGEAMRVLLPGESCKTPMVHCGMFRCNDDKIVHAMHRYLLHTVMPKAVPGREMEIEANHRGYLSDRENTPDICRDIDIASQMGVELYVIDAGWYGDPPNQWWNNVGDWFSAPWIEGGLEVIVNHARSRGLKFGLWIEAEASGAHSRLRREHPEWSMTRGDTLVADGRALDLTKPEVLQWVYNQIKDHIDRYALDLYRIDNNHDMGLGGTRIYGGKEENLTWRYYDAFYDLFKRLKGEYPGVVFQGCSGGGGRHDFGALRYFHTYEFTDCMRPPRLSRVYNGLTMALPSGYGLRVFGTEAGDLTVEGDLLSQLRGAFIARPIFRGIAPDHDSINAVLSNEIRWYILLYKRFLRPLLLEADMYHHTPFLPLEKPAPWMIVEFAAQDRKRGAICAFATGTDAQQRTVVYPRGLDCGQRYLVTDVDFTSQIALSGYELMRHGLTLQGHMGTSRLWLFEKVESNSTDNS